MLIEDITKFIGIRPISLVDLVGQKLSDQNATKVGLLASPASLKSGLFSSALPSGIQILQPKNQDTIEKIIRNTIAGRDVAKNRAVLEAEVNKLLQRGASTVILGCTELSVIAQDQINGTIDPLKMVAVLLLADSS